MEKNYRPIIEFVLAREAGFVDDPDDPGGATNMGITIATLGAWRGGNATVAEVRSLTRHEAELIYHRNYWTAAGCPDLPAGVDLVVMDACVMSGIEPSLNFLRRQLGLAVKLRNAHKLYPKTEKHLRVFEQQRLQERLHFACMPAVVAGVSERRRDFYRSLGTFTKFGKGWLKRVDMAQRLAMHLWATQSLTPD